MTNLATLDALTAKVKRAKKHVQNLESVLRTFPSSRKDCIRFEDDHKTRERSYYVTKLPDISAEVAVIAGDILQNLRSALDHLACHLVTVNGGTVTKYTYFPIFDSANDCKPGEICRKVKGARPEAIKYIAAFEPYKGGRYLLWELHELNKIDKHRLLLTTCSTNIAHTMSPSECAALEELHRKCHPAAPYIQLRNALKPFPVSVPLNVGHKLLTIPHSEMREEMRFLIDVAFNEPQIVECKPIVELLHKMSEVVLNLILGFSSGGFL